MWSWSIASTASRATLAINYDFLEYDLLELLKQHNVAFVSVTQGFDTTTAMGRAMLGVAAVFGSSRLDDLVKVPARVRFVSAKPLLGSLGDLSPWLPELHWMIVGGESGSHLKLHPLRQMDHAWAREIRDQFVEHDVPFFFKQSSGLRSEQDPFLMETDGTVAAWQQFPRAAGY